MFIVAPWCSTCCPHAEGVTPIHDEHGQLRDFQDSHGGFGRYTDDTQMTLALAASLVEVSRLSAEHVSAKPAGEAMSRL